VGTHLNVLRTPGEPTTPAGDCGVDTRSDETPFGVCILSARLSQGSGEYAATAGLCYKTALRFSGWTVIGTEWAIPNQIIVDHLSLARP